MSYRPPSRPPVGGWAKHLHKIRRERDLSQQQAFELVSEGLHLSPKSRAVYIALDMGDRQPRPDEAEYLATVFGWPEEQDTPTPAADQAALIAALTRQAEALERQTAAIDALVVQMTRVAEGQVGMGSVLAEIAGLALGIPAPQGSPSESQPPPVNGGSGARGPGR